MKSRIRDIADGGLDDPELAHRQANNLLQSALFELRRWGGKNRTATDSPLLAPDGEKGV
jgi:hypothetical protein